LFEFSCFQHFQQFFHSRLMEKGICSYDAVASWTKNVDVFKLKKILIPINVGNWHWIAAMVSMTEKATELCDPMPGPGGQNANTQRHFDQMLRFLRDEHFNIKLASSFAKPTAS
jgi:Ulp1 family protease